MEIPVDLSMAGNVLCRVPMRCYHWHWDNLSNPRVIEYRREANLSLRSGGRVGICWMVSIDHL